MPELNGPYLLHDLLQSTARLPGKQAIVDHGKSYSHDDLLQASTRCAGVLTRLGLQRGDRVAVFLPKTFAECWAIFGTSRADGVIVPINSLLRAQQVRHIVADCEARFLITDSRSWNALKGELGDVHSLMGVLLVDDCTDDTDMRLVPLAFEGPAQLPGTCRAIGEDLAAILYTSGSTGRPKGVMLSHRNLLAGTRIVRTYLGITPQDRLLSVLPFSFDYGLNQLLTAMEQGATLVLLNFRFGNEIVDTLAKQRITGFAGVPTIWAIIAKSAKRIAKSDLSALRYITNTGGAVPTETVGRLRELLPTTNIFLMYGLTEAFRSTYLPPEELDRRPTSIGKAIPECEIFVLNAEGARAGPGEAGILVHRGPTVSMGYWRRPEETAKVIRPNPLRDPLEGADLVCVSGDLVRQDDDGFLYFVARNDAMIKSSGYRISPTEVEEHLMGSGHFGQVAVIGLPDPVVGQIVHAVAVAAGAKPSIQDVLAQCASALPAYMVPRDIELVDALPVSPNGKVDYKALVAERTARKETV
ncbi:MAG: acyl-CoA ligase (AMP-forming), exosortase A system-associated [Hyphomicrobiaceae bacterium]